MTGAEKMGRNLGPCLTLGFCSLKAPHKAELVRRPPPSTTAAPLALDNTPSVTILWGFFCPLLPCSGLPCWFCCLFFFPDSSLWGTWRSLPSYPWGLCEVLDSVFPEPTAPSAAVGGVPVPWAHQGLEPSDKRGKAGASGDAGEERGEEQGAQRRVAPS